MGKKYSKNYVFYQLAIEDIQTVAREVYGRELSDEEIKKVMEPIADRISWYDAVDDAISGVLGLEPKEEDEDEI